MATVVHVCFCFLSSVACFLFLFTETQVEQTGLMGKVDRRGPVRTNDAEFARGNYNVLRHLLNLWDACEKAAFLIT